MASPSPLDLTRPSFAPRPKPRPVSTVSSNLPTYSTNSDPPDYVDAVDSSPSPSKLRRVNPLEPVERPCTPPASALALSDTSTPHALRTARCDHVRRGDAVLEEEEVGDDRLDRLLAQTANILSTASDCLTQLIESREHLRRFQAMDDALERTMIAHEANFRRRASSAGLEQSMRDLARDADDVLGPATVIVRRPSHLGRVATPSHAHTLYINATAAESPSITSEGGPATPGDAPALQPKVVTPARAESAAATATARYSPSAIFSGWFASAPVLSTSSAKLPPAKDVLETLAPSPAAAAATPCSRPSPSRPRHQCVEASLAISAPLITTPSRPSSPPPPAPLTYSRPRPFLSSPAGPYSSPSGPLIPGAAEPHPWPPIRPSHVRKDSRQPSMSSDIQRRDAGPRRDDVHAEWTVSANEGMTARDKLLAMSGRAGPR